MSESPKPESAARRVVGDVIRPFASALELFGRHVEMSIRALKWMPKRPFRAENYIESCEYVGVGSLPIILLVGAFTGMVTALQSVFIFRIFGLDAYVAGFTAKALALELGPVLTSLMLAGRVGAGIATEIGTMRITEQIDALESMAVNPTQYLILPRLVAGLLMAPILALLFFIVGMGGCYLVAVVLEGVDHGAFISNLTDLMRPADVMQGLLKASVFGFVVALIGCYQGYNAAGGGRGVGIGTTRAVVYSSVVILVLDYFLTDLLLMIIPQGSAF